MRKLILLFVLLVIPLSISQAAEFVVDDFRDLSDWEGQIVGQGQVVMINGEASKTVSQEWSGYRTLEIEQKTPAKIIVTLLDADGELWQAEGQGNKLLFPFDSFKLIATSNISDKKLSTGNIQRMTLQGHSEIEIIGLGQSKGFNGPNVYVETANKYYAGKTWQKVAGEIKGKGFTAVHLTPVELTPETYYKQKEIVDAFHAVGLPVALTIYPGTDFDAYRKHPEWHQSFLQGGGSEWSWRVYNCLREEEFIAYTIKYLQDQFVNNGYDALHVSEPWLEVWGGPTKPSEYACFCPRCREGFQTEAGVDPYQLFDKNSSSYYTKNPELYKKWVDFRVNTVATFVNKIITGLRKVKPDVPAYVMFLSDVSVEPGKTREYQAMDLERFAQISDGVIIETAWQDWTKSNLWPGYILAYGKEYAPRVYVEKPEAILYAQPDVGSNWDEMHRSPEWLRVFSAYANRAGFDGYIAYEYSQMGYRLLPTTQIVIDDFEKKESDLYWEPFNTSFDEVLAGRIGKDAFEGQGCLMLFYSGESKEGFLAVEKDVMLDLNGFTQLEVMTLFDLFTPGEKVKVKYEIQTDHSIYNASTEVIVADGWQKVIMPFVNFGSSYDLSHVKKIRIGIDKSGSIPNMAKILFDMFVVAGTRRSFLDTQHLPLTTEPKPTNVAKVSEATVEIGDFSRSDNELNKVELSLNFVGGERSLSNLMVDIIVCEKISGLELPKLGRTLKIGSLRRESKKVINTDILLPTGTYKIILRLYTQGSNFLSQEALNYFSEDYLLEVP